MNIAPRTMINVPTTARAGEVITIRTLVPHDMQTGYSVTERGERIPRNIINRFVCTYDGEEVFSADLFPAIAANPFFVFTTIATRSGTITFAWTDDHDVTSTTAVEIKVV